MLYFLSVLFVLLFDILRGRPRGRITMHACADAPFGLAFDHSESFYIR